MKKVYHELDPFYDEEALVLILGSMPSVKSRELGFYYMHPQNRFYKTLAKVYDEKIPNTIDERKSFLKRHKIACWDVIKSCSIVGSSDASITDVKVNNIHKIIKATKIKHIFTTGKKAYTLYRKYCFEKTKIEAIYLPSTSPLNCPKRIEEKLVKEYSIIKEITK